jgi:hypothetical protein
MGASIDRSLAIAKGTGIHLKLMAKYITGWINLCPVLRDHATCSYTFMT